MFEFLKILIRTGNIFSLVLNTGPGFEKKGDIFKENIEMMMG